MLLDRNLVKISTMYRYLLHFTWSVQKYYKTLKNKYGDNPSVFEGKLRGVLKSLDALHTALTLTTAFPEVDAASGSTGERRSLLFASLPSVEHPYLFASLPSAEAAENQPVCGKKALAAIAGIANFYRSIHQDVLRRAEDWESGTQEGPSTYPVPVPPFTTRCML